ncbi:MAG: ribosome small subunit-dependent GTPase A [Muribaculaceae bacterium]|nr:ribosome small subunit-dependent GTPase A [Muribaculaceae bacterium]
MKGKVTKNTGAHYLVETDDNGALVPCKVKGNFRIKGIRTTNPVAVGDNVTISDPGTDGVAYITAISPRTNYIIRRASNLSKESHIIAANIDQALLVVTLAHPTTSTTFVDRFLASAEAYNIPVVIAVNKTDLLSDDDDREYLDGFAYLYESIGYRVVKLSALTREGLDQLGSLLKDRITLISGNSGVGKSTIINDLIPGLDLRTAEISAAHDQGMHTTTFSELFKLPEGGSIIDTPGIRGFGTVDFEPAQVAHYFPELFAESANCKFNNCTHTHEPGCAVLRAVEEQRISRSRYSSYLSILNDAGESKYR